MRSGGGQIGEDLPCQGHETNLTNAYLKELNRRNHDTSWGSRSHLGRSTMGQESLKLETSWG